MNNHLVLDLEWSVHNTVGSNKGSAFCSDNFVVLAGTLYEGVTTVTPTISTVIEFINGYSGTLVGNNFKSDIHHLRKNGFRFREFVARGGKIFSCDIAEYVLTAQEAKFASLDELSLKYGGTLKDSRLKELWDAGVQTEDMDQEMLASYLEGDLLNTEIVYKAQVEAAKKSGQTPLIEAMMDAALAVAEIEWNGMPVDLKELDIQTERLRGLRLTAIGDCGAEVAKVAPEGIPPHAWNLNSNQQLSALFFGGTIKWDESVPCGTFKSGLRAGHPKFKKEGRSVILNKRFEPEDNWKTAKDGVYSVADSVLEALEARGSDLAKALRRFRELDKEYSTYAENLPKLIHSDGRVHQNLHQTSTNTGRLSASEPNLQNQPTGSEIKRVFGSRYEDGRLVSLDFKQIEVVIAAWDSGDPQMIADVVAGRDAHEETGKVAFPGQTMTKTQKREVKGVNFGKCIYGGGTQTVHLQTGVPKDIIETVAKAFFGRYPRFREWQNELLQQIDQTAFYAGDRTKEGAPARRAYYTTQTGRKYLFVEETPPEWLKARGVEVSFNPPKIKNNRVQGTATGDIVPLVLGRMFRLMCKGPMGKVARLVNTIHDNIVADCRTPEDAKWVGKHLQIEAERAPEVLKEVFGFEFPLPLRVTVATGSNWYEVDQE